MILHVSFTHDIEMLGFCLWLTLCNFWLLFLIVGGGWDKLPATMMSEPLQNVAGQPR